MSDVKWIKICTDIFDDDKILLIESLPESDSMIVIWFKLLCLAGKQNNGGVFMLNDRIAYTDEMLATIFRRPLNTVRMSLETFEKFGMIELVNNIYTIPNWEKHQNADKMEQMREYNRLAQKRSRDRRKQLAESCQENVIDMSMTVNTQKKNEEKEEEFHSFTPETARKILGGIGKGVVMLSDEQMEDLLDKLSLEEFDRYVGIVADCELAGKTYKKKTHYKAILDMAMKDRKVVK